MDLVGFNPDYEILEPVRDKIILGFKHGKLYCMFTNEDSIDDINVSSVDRIDVKELEDIFRWFSEYNECEECGARNSTVEEIEIDGIKEMLCDYCVGLYEDR